MLFETPLIEGRLVRRYKRFLADVELPGGRVIVAHCPNPGSMRTCAPDRGRVWLSVHDHPRRKLPYTWELVEVDGAMVCVNTARANDVVAEAIESGVIAELAGYDEMRREVAWGAGSRIDFSLIRRGEQCWVEVKSATMDGGDHVAAFPDSVTARGTRHLGDLMVAAKAGHRAVLLFCCNRSGTRAVRPADEIDPLYGYTLRRAADSGVEILAYASDIDPSGIRLRQRIPVELPPLDYTPPRRPRSARRRVIRRGGKKTVRMIDPAGCPGTECEAEFQPSGAAGRPAIRSSGRGRIM